MIREPVTLPQRPRISMRSSARFFHLVDVIARASEPTATQLMALELDGLVARLPGGLFQRLNRASRRN